MTLKQIIDFDILSFDRICEKIRNGEHFSLARYGDGEFNAILGKQGANCDGHEYFPEMGRELAETLRSKPEYYVGLHQSAKIQQETLIWLSRNKLIGNEISTMTDAPRKKIHRDRQFVANSVFHDPVRDGKMGQFWEALEGKDVVVLAPDYVTAMHAEIEAEFVIIPGKNTYSHLPEIKEWLNGCDCSGKVVLICASMTAPLIVDHLYRQYGTAATFIDFGSSFDPYCGVKSRSFHKNLVK